MPAQLKQKYENGRWVAIVEPVDDSGAVNAATGNTSGTEDNGIASNSSQSSSQAEFDEESYDILEGQVTMRVADMGVKCRGAVKLKGLGSVLSGTYYVSGMKISLSSATMKQTLTVHRDSLNPSVEEGIEETRLVAVDTESATKTYTVKSGDSLSKIALNNLGSANRWQEIYQLNADTIGTNPNKIYAGQKFILPA